MFWNMPSCSLSRPVPPPRQRCEQKLKFPFHVATLLSNGSSRNSLDWKLDGGMGKEGEGRGGEGTTRREGSNEREEGARAEPRCFLRCDAPRISAFWAQSLASSCVRIRRHTNAPVQKANQIHRLGSSVWELYYLPIMIIPPCWTRNYCYLRFLSAPPKESVPQHQLHFEVTRSDSEVQPDPALPLRARDHRFCTYLTSYVMFVSLRRKVYLNSVSIHKPVCQ